MNFILHITIFSWTCSTAFTSPPNRNSKENQPESIGTLFLLFVFEPWNLVRNSYLCIWNITDYHLKINNTRMYGIQSAHTFSRAKTDLITTKYRWPNKTVPYQFSMDHTSEQRNHIEMALKIIESVSCVKFIRRTNETDYIEITASSLIVLTSGLLFLFLFPIQ